MFICYLNGPEKKKPLFPVTLEKKWVSWSVNFLFFLCFFLSFFFFFFSLQIPCDM